MFPKTALWDRYTLWFHDVKRMYHGSMPLELRDIVGYAAAILTTVAFVPQNLKSRRTRDPSGVPLTMCSLFTAGVALRLVW